MDRQAHPLSGRIYLLSVAVAASLLVAGGSFVVTWRNWTAVTHATDRMMAVNDASQELRVIYGAMAANGGAVMTGDPAALAQGEANSRRFDEVIEELGAAVAGDPRAEALFARLTTAREASLQNERELYRLLHAGDLQAAMRLVQSPAFFQAGAEFGPVQEQLITQANQGARRAYAQAAVGERNALLGSAAGILVVVALWAAIALDWLRQTRAARALHDNLERLVEERTKQLEVALDQANAANHAKSAFLATMSHELRTPLNGVLGMAGALGGSGLDAAQKAMLDVIDEAGRDLLALVSDILDFAWLEGGGGEPELAPFDLEDLLEQVLTPHIADAKAKSLSVKLGVDASARGGYLGDRERISQLLGALMSNAVKFTEEGGVTVRVSDVDQGLKVSIADTGCGIPQDKIDVIFERFMQGDGSYSRAHGGAGLGLARAKLLASFLGGEMGVTSREGEGSTFWFVLPLERCALAPASCAA